MSLVEEADGKWNYAVEYDPDAAQVELMLQAVSTIGFRPSREGPIEASAAGESVEVTVTGAKLERGKAGSIDVRLSPKAGAKLGEVSISVSSEDLGVQSESSPEGKPRSVKVDVTVAKDAEPGEHVLIVVVKSGEDEVRLRVPVQVE